MNDKGQIRDIRQEQARAKGDDLDSFVLEKGIFSNIFEKDIKRVYIYKKTERLAKALHLIAPAFRNSPALAHRMDAIAVALVDAATLAPVAAREALSRELLTLSSVLSIGRVGGLLSSMNSDLIAREAHALLEEIASYEEPRLFLDDAPTLAALQKASTVSAPRIATTSSTTQRPREAVPVKDTKGHSNSSASGSSRRASILAILEKRGPSYIKDISTVIRDVSEKTIQRELAQLVAEGAVSREGERRWTTYQIAS